MVAVLGFAGGMFSFGGTVAALGAGAVGGAWAGAGFAATVLGGLTVKLLTTVAISSLSQALASEPAQGGGISIPSTLRGEEHPETIILGRYATAGQAICPPMSWGGSNKQLVYVIELCSAPGATLERIRIGDEWAELVPVTGPVTMGNNPPVIWNDSRGYEVRTEAYGSGRIWIRYYDGTQTAADPYLLEKFGADPDRPWTASMVGRGICYAVVTFRYHPEKMPSVPPYLFEMQGIPLYDIRKDGSAGGVGPQRLDDPSTWTSTDNPIVMVWNAMHGVALPGGEIWGGGFTDLRWLPQTVWITAMNRCDSAIAVAAGGTEPRYRAGLEISLSDAPASGIEELLKAAAATIADQGWGWTIQAGGPGLPVYAFTDQDVIVSTTQDLDPFPRLDETWNAVSAKYPDPELFWETREAPRRTNPDWEAADVFGRRTASLSLPAVPYKRQIQRLMRPWLEAERRFRRHSNSLPPDSAHVDLCDVVDWSSVRNGYVGKDFEVVEISEDLRTCISKLALREVDPADYSWVPGFELPSAPVSPVRTPPAAITVPGWAVSAVTLKDASGADRRPAIRMSWDGDVGATGLRWQIRLQDGTEVQFEGTETDLERGRRTVAAGILPGTAYQVRAILLSRRPTAWTGWASVTTPAVSLGAGDIDIDAVKAEINDQIAEFEDFVDEATGLIDDLYDIADANLTIARDYTDTRILTESLIRETATEALALQISELSAVPTGTSYLLNGTFAEGLANWTGGGGFVSIAQRNTSSTNPLLAGAPTENVLSFATATANNVIYQGFDLGSWADGESVKWRINLASRGTDREVICTVRFYNAAAVQLTSLSRSIVLPVDKWKIHTGSAPIPAAAVSARFELTRVGTAKTQNIFATEVSAEKIDMAVMARVTTLEVAQATTDAALSGYLVETEARLDDLESGAGAASNTVSTLQSRVANTESGLTANSDSINQASARVDRIRASGLIRISSVASPAGAQSRVAISAEAGANDTSHSAALYLEARSDGTSSAGLVADRFYIAQGAGPAAARSAPFIVQGGKIYIDAALIGEAWIDTLHIAGGAITVPGVAQQTAQRTVSNIWTTIVQVGFTRAAGMPTHLFFSGRFDGFGASRSAAFRLMNLTTGTQIEEFHNISPGAMVSMSYELIDTDTSGGWASYAIQMMGLNGDMRLYNRRLKYWQFKR